VHDLPPQEWRGAYNATGTTGSLAQAMAWREASNNLLQIGSL
jgi:hypothetical protein